MAAAGLAAKDRAKVILFGVIAATVLRVIFALLTVQLLKIIGLLLAGGLLLLWVCWKLWREIAEQRAARAALAPATDGAPGSAPDAPEAPRKTFRQAVVQIIIADVSMSLDNVLAVAGVARDNAPVLVFGLVLSVALMGLAATWIARLLERHHWIAYVGLVVIFYVAVRMIVDGAAEISSALGLG